MKIPRFVKEYAGFQKDAIMAGFMPEKTKAEAANHIDNVCRMCAIGLITVDEAMNAICHWRKFFEEN